MRSRNSAKLGALAFIVVVPLGIAGGVLSALHAGRWIDRAISIAGLSATVVPEFVSSIVLILVFGVWLQLAADRSDRARPTPACSTQLQHLILPVLPLVLVFFGYIARMARAGTVEALDADYTRTAILKGLPRRTVIWRHVLRNALLPTVTVAATQLGYMIGGLVVVETLFHYQGIGSLIYNAAKAKDFPMLEAGVLTVGVIYTAANLIADALYVVLNPRLRVKESPNEHDRRRSAAPRARRRASKRCDALLRSPTFVIGALILLFWVVCALVGHWSCRTTRTRPIRSTRSRRPTRTHWFGTDQLGRDVFSRVIVGARDILTIAPLATLLGTLGGHGARARSSATSTAGSTT